MWYLSSWRDLRRRSNAGHGLGNKPEITPPSHSYHRPDGPLMGRNPADTRADGEGHLNHFIKRGLVSGSAEGAMVLIPVQGLQGGIGVKHAATAGTEDIPGHLECPKPSGVEECGDCLLLVQAVVGCERESINAVQVAICAVLDEVFEALRDLWVR